MFIKYIYKGSVASVIITSTFFEIGKHNRIVDTVIFCTPGVRVNKTGYLIMRSVISGATADILRAYRTACREAER
ncbi:hypothetical protein BIY27_00025 [Gibbsiella quercinecans]|nr:hypothetical protein BIY27_00025 [Gibbsiella quercinecans]